MSLPVLLAGRARSGARMIGPAGRGGMGIRAKLARCPSRSPRLASSCWTTRSGTARTGRSRT
eukprot:14201755-Alexandrium_andersonii.AAC.1